MVRAASEAMICDASGRSYGLRLAGGRNVAGGFNTSERYARLASESVTDDLGPWLGFA